MEISQYIFEKMAAYCVHCGLQLWIDGLNKPPIYNFILAVDLKRCWRRYEIDTDMIDDPDAVVN